MGCTLPSASSYSFFVTLIIRIKPLVSNKFLYLFTTFMQATYPPCVLWLFEILLLFALRTFLLHKVAIHVTGDAWV